ncbi:MAG: ARPP-1 family domain-containing protein [Candidatus Hydrogenedentales bacterium]|jgi:hypothetical protein
MNKKICQHDVLLGEIEVNLAGMQYCRAVPTAGEKVHFEREPDNSHDRKAIRVENEDFAQVGYLPRKVAAWLTPLIDQGIVYTDGVVAACPKTHIPSATLAVSIYGTPSNAAFLQAVRDPEALPGALHRIVLEAYNAMHDWRRPTLIRDVAERLGELSRRDLLPETRLLLALMPGVAQTLEAHADIGAVGAVRSVLSGLTVGEALHYRNATVFPLYLVNGHERAYILLEEALEAGAAEVTETSQHGTVPEILIRNRGERPILLPEGEILTGAKQNRVINITMLIAAQSELVVPVSCVEQGRWSSVSQRFRATHFATPHIRARKCARVMESVACRGSFDGDQSEVWRDVAQELRCARAESRTASLTDGLEAARGRVEDYRQRLTLPEDAAGVAIASDSRVVLFELFDTPRTMQRLWPRLSEACFFAFAHNNNENKPASERVIRDFAGRVQENLQVLDETRGLGVGIGLSGRSVSGTGLCYEGRLLHFAAFPIEQ